MKTSASIQYIRVGLRKRNTHIKLKLRWDRAPRTCEAVLSKLPVENQVWHAKFANNEVYTLISAFDTPLPPEWNCAFPAPGDMLCIPVAPGVWLPPGAPPMDMQRGVIDLAYFYDRGNSLLHGPSGPVPGTIFSTAVSIEDIERMAVACSDVWMSGAIDETLFIEAV